MLRLGLPFVRLQRGLRCVDAELNKKVESSFEAAAVSVLQTQPPRAGQNAETRSNGAALGRAMMLFLTPILNTAGAAGFSAQGSLLLYERQNINTGQLPGG